MKINAGEIRVGMLLEYKNDLWQVLKTQHVKPGKGGAFAQVEMKSLNKNTKLNERFRSSETVEKASLEETTFNYLYSDERNYFFIACNGLYFFYVFHCSCIYNYLVTIFNERWYLNANSIAKFCRFIRR